MGIDIRQPNITAQTAEGKLAQMQSYLYQLTEQLQWALNSIDTTNGSEKKVVYDAKGNVLGTTKAESNFNEIKALIISSADIIEAYAESISHKLKGKYVAKSEFGEFEQDTNATLEATSEKIDQTYDNFQKLIGGEDIDETIYVSANIRTGLLDHDKESGVPIYGMEVGQKTEKNGEVSFEKYARFTPSRISFYDAYDNEVAYMSDQVLHISRAEILTELVCGSKATGCEVQLTPQGMMIFNGDEPCFIANSGGVQLNGYLYARAGSQIGGWKTQDNQMYARGTMKTGDTEETYRIQINADLYNPTQVIPFNPVFGVMNETKGTWPFLVRSNGALEATGAKIGGTVAAGGLSATAGNKTSQFDQDGFKVTIPKLSEEFDRSSIELTSYQWDTNIAVPALKFTLGDKSGYLYMVAGNLHWKFDSNKAIQITQTPQITNEEE